ncbi:GGDEF domain-containing protein [Sorangium sp. So ce291]|uniref:GGDEF domain-containing protein n=1 Tax=Sorangium sp. So ce291 TaxID=3133294 RepID=UPI003F5DBF02
MNDLDPELEETLDQLRQAVRRTVRKEQLVDRLTKLGNDDALSEWIEGQISRAGDFWLAFVEVDRFKGINDVFGYENADELLRRIAAQLLNGSANFFAPPATPFRAHGDEFFIGGDGAGDGISEALEHIRASIAALRIKVDGKPEPMKCTVSIGWATSRDAQMPGQGILTGRHLRGLLERAVAEAKHKRDRVLRYDSVMKKPSVRDGRTDCAVCRTKFTVSVPIDDTRNKELHCPNCWSDVGRPPSLEPDAPSINTAPS